jgi:hypothetical protein
LISSCTAANRCSDHPSWSRADLAIVFLSR